MEYLCDKCNKICKSKSGLIIHEKTHKKILNNLKIISLNIENGYDDFIMFPEILDNVIKYINANTDTIFTQIIEQYNTTMIFSKEEQIIFIQKLKEILDNKILNKSYIFNCFSKYQLYYNKKNHYFYKNYNYQNKKYDEFCENCTNITLPSYLSN